MHARLNSGRLGVALVAIFLSVSATDSGADAQPLSTFPPETDPTLPQSPPRERLLRRPLHGTSSHRPLDHHLMPDAAEGVRARPLSTGLLLDRELPSIAQSGIPFLTISPGSAQFHEHAVPNQGTASCGDERDDMIREYIHLGLPTQSCSDFVSNVDSNDFPWHELNAPEDNPHSRKWGVFHLLESLEATKDAYGGDIEVTSGYRCPHVNKSLDDASLKSRHQFGDAVDIRPRHLDDLLDEREYNRLAAALREAMRESTRKPDWVSPYLFYEKHMHIEFERN